MRSVSSPTAPANSNGGKKAGTSAVPGSSAAVPIKVEPRSVSRPQQLPPAKKPSGVRIKQEAGVGHTNDETPPSAKVLEKTKSTVRPKEITVVEDTVPPSTDLAKLDMASRAVFELGRRRSSP